MDNWCHRMDKLTMRTRVRQRMDDGRCSAVKVTLDFC
jgi:hypothetical protein